MLERGKDIATYEEKGTWGQKLGTTDTPNQLSYLEMRHATKKKLTEYGAVVTDSDDR